MEYKNHKYRILGVDPGTNEMGYAILEVRGKKIQLVQIDTVKMYSLKEHTKKLAHIFNVLTELIQQFQPTQMAIEAPFFGKNVQSMLKLGRAQGVAIAAGMTNGLKITEYSPKKIKQSVTGNGNASKEQVAAMIENVFGKNQAPSLDATDAAATALCHFYQSGSNGLAEKKYNGWESFLKENPNRVKGS